MYEIIVTLRCPYCKDFLDDMQFDINEGDKINKLVICPNGKCEKKFRLKVEGV